MYKRLYIIFSVFIFLLIPRLSVAAERIYNILFVQSYAAITPWHDTLSRGLKDGFNKSGLKVNITTKYLNAASWNYQSEKLIMRRFCERARERKTDLIVTSGDEAFHTLLTCGDSLPFQLPVVFFSVKYPEGSLVNSQPNVCGYTVNPDFGNLMRHVNRLFPKRTKVVCISDNTLLSLRGKEDFMGDWEKFVKDYPQYTVTYYNSQKDTTNKIIASTCYPHLTHHTLIIAPKWSTFMSFIGSNSKAPFYSCENLALTDGAFAAYDVDPYDSAFEAAKTAASVLRGKSPSEVGIIESPSKFIYDFKQLEFFKYDPQRVVDIGGVIVNEPYMEKYSTLFTLLYGSILILLVFLIVWLYRINRRESTRRIHAQTRLLIQSRLVAQRDEFYNVFHSIRDGVITYDTNYRINFINHSLLKMMCHSEDEESRFYEGLPAGSLFTIYNDGNEILLSMLRQVMEKGVSVVIPENSFMQQAYSGSYFPVSGEIVPIWDYEKITGLAFSVRNISDEEIQKRFFQMAVEESFIYPWQYNISTRMFTFPEGFLKHFGLDEKETTVSRDEIEQMIHPDDQKFVNEQFNQVLTGLSQSIRVNFRQLCSDGNYEWWEYRSSVLAGLTTDTPYSVLGVCQSIQRYKTTEEQLTAARDKALQADKLKSAFLANMSHEIRTPLNAIVGFSDLLRDTSGFSEEEVKLFIETINKNCGLLLTLINDILDLSRIESGTMDFRFASHNLSLLMKTVYDSQRLNMPSGVQLKLKLPENSKKYIMTDNVRLQQVINNLINNAAKFTSEGSIVLGYTEEEPGYTSLFVEDTGKGISEEGLKHVFERFYKVDSFTQGAGLGLSICQTIVERLNGTITVVSKEGHGTRFTVRVPDVCE